MGRQLLIVDDETDILEILNEALRGEGYEVVAFLNPARALEHCLTNLPDLVITDLLMPGLSGQELVRHLRERFGGALPIVVMSASVNMAAVAPLPIQAFVSKPFDLDDLSDLLKRLLVAVPEPEPQAVRVSPHPPGW